MVTSLSPYGSGRNVGTPLGYVWNARHFDGVFGWRLAL